MATEDCRSGDTVVGIGIDSRLPVSQAVVDPKNKGRESAQRISAFDFYPYSLSLFPALLPFAEAIDEARGDAEVVLDRRTEAGDHVFARKAQAERRGEVVLTRNRSIDCEGIAVVPKAQ